MELAWEYTSFSFLLQYFRLELLYVEQLMKRQKVLGIENMNTSTQDSVLRGEIALVVYEEALAKIPHPSLVIQFIDVTRKFDFTVDLQRQMLKYNDIIHQNPELSLPYIYDFYCSVLMVLLLMIVTVLYLSICTHHTLCANFFFFLSCVALKEIIKFFSKLCINTNGGKSYFRDLEEKFPTSEITWDTLARRALEKDDYKDPSSLKDRLRHCWDKYEEGLKATEGSETMWSYYVETCMEMIHASPKLMDIKQTHAIQVMKRAESEGKLPERFYSDLVCFQLFCISFSSC